jgi:hypothetical protein
MVDLRRRDAIDAGLPDQQAPSRPRRGDTERAQPLPRWLKGLGVLGILFVVLFVILHLTGNVPGGHGP